MRKAIGIVGIGWGFWGDIILLSKNVHGDTSILFVEKVSDFLTVVEAAKLSVLSHWTIRAHLQRAAFTRYKSGSRTLVNRSQLLELVRPKDRSLVSSPGDFMDLKAEQQIFARGKLPVIIQRTDGEFSLASIDTPFSEDYVGVVAIVDGKPISSLAVELSANDIQTLADAYVGYVAAELLGVSIDFVPHILPRKRRSRSRIDRPPVR